MKKLKIYLDSTIIGFSVNIKDPAYALDWSISSVPQNKSSSVMSSELHRQVKDLERYKDANKLLKMINSKVFDGYISYLTIKEIKQSPAWISELLTAKIKSSKLKIIKANRHEEIVNLQEKYLERKIIPKHFKEDAEHIAIATIYSLDALVSYNFKHIVRIETMVGVNKVNIQQGYKEIFLCQPMEVIKNEK